MPRGECPNPRPECWQAEPYSDEDHTYWPKERYIGWLACTFRNLPENKEQKCRCDHETRHLTETPPDKPSRNVMKEMIRESYRQGRISLTPKQRKLLGL